MHSELFAVSVGVPGTRRTPYLCIANELCLGDWRRTAHLVDDRVECLHVEVLESIVCAMPVGFIKGVAHISLRTNCLTRIRGQLAIHGHFLYPKVLGFFSIKPDLYSEVCVSCR